MARITYLMCGMGKRHDSMCRSNFSSMEVVEHRRSFITG